jgi:hypothetical protein
VAISMCRVCRPVDYSPANLLSALAVTSSPVARGVIDRLPFSNETVRALNAAMEAELKEIAVCKQLRSLNVALCAGVTDAGIDHLKKALPT